MSNDRRSDTIGTFLLHAIYLVSGTVTVLIGPLLPILARRFDLGDMDAGMFFPAQFAGSLTGTILSSRFGRVGRFYDAAWIGGFAMAAGVMLLSFEIRGVVIGGFLLMGIGIGLTLPAINMLILERSRDNAGSALSILNLCWGIGAILCKPFMDMTQDDDSTVSSSVILSVAFVLMSAVMLAVRPQSIAITRVAARSESQKSLWTTLPILLITAFNFVHVGFESSVGGWLAAYTERVGGSGGSVVSPVLVYFVMFVAGRAAAPLILRLVPEVMMIPIGLAQMFAGVVLILFANSVELLCFGAVFAGFGTSWIFPINIARFHHAAGDARDVDATPFFLFGTFGAAVSTWMIGYVSDTAGSLRSGMTVLLISVIALIVMQAAIFFVSDRNK